MRIGILATPGSNDLLLGLGNELAGVAGIGLLLPLENRITAMTKWHYPYNRDEFVITLVYRHWRYFRPQCVGAETSSISQSGMLFVQNQSATLHIYILSQLPFPIQKAFWTRLSLCASPSTKYIEVETKCLIQLWTTGQALHITNHRTTHASNVRIIMILSLVFFSF